MTYSVSIEGPSIFGGTLLTIWQEEIQYIKGTLNLLKKNSYLTFKASYDAECVRILMTEGMRKVRIDVFCAPDTFSTFTVLL